MPDHPIDILQMQSRLQNLKQLNDDLQNEFSHLEATVEVYHKRLGVIEKLVDKIHSALLGGITPEGKIVKGFINEAQPWMEYCLQCKTEKDQQRNDAKKDFRGIRNYVFGVLIVSFVVSICGGSYKIITGYKNKMDETTILLEKLKMQERYHNAPSKSN